MKLFRVDYDGLWLGGTAFVFALNEEEAKEKVKNDIHTAGFEGVRVTEIKQEGVVFNCNGDY